MRLAISLLVLVFGWPVLVSAKPTAPACESLLTSTRQVLSWLRELDVRARDYERTPAYENLLRHIQAKLQEYGISSRRRFKKMEDKARTVVEVTDILPLNVNGRILRRARERFGLRVFFDPVMRRLDEGRGSTDAPEAPVIYLDVLQLQKEFHRPNAVMLHEIRHIFFSHKTAEGGRHRYQGELLADDEGSRFERAGFYEDEISFEELSNYRRDASLQRRRYARGEVSKRDYLYDLNHLRRIAALLAKHLRMVDFSLPNRELFTEAADTYDGVVLVWPVFSGAPSSGGRRAQFDLHLDFPGVRENLPVRFLRAEAEDRVRMLIAESDRVWEDAVGEIARVETQSKNDN